MNPVNEYYIYNDKVVSGSASNFGPVGTRITTDSIISVVSGLMDSRRAVVLSYLHKAIKPLNQLRMIEDATVIYRDQWQTLKAAVLAQQTTNKQCRLINCYLYYRYNYNHVSSDNSIIIC